MGAFRESNNFAIEFALRTQINYFQLLYLEHKNTDNTSERLQIEGKLRELHTKMEHFGFLDVDLCCGTQLMNSVIGLLLIPQQEFFDEIVNDDSYQTWESHFPNLAKYVFSNNSRKFENTYFLKENGIYFDVPEPCNPQNVLRHMRNSLSHKRILFFPKNARNNAQVSSIVFKDITYKNSKTGTPYQQFKLQIDKDDLETILFEISNYFISLGTH